MEIFTIKNLNFMYPNASKNALDNINLKINKGDFLLLCGLSGSGKTTLLKLLKPEIMPHGTLEGSILFNGVDINEVNSPNRIGFVFQNPNDQIVTDKVWYELAFGLENMGLDSDIIQRRIAEISHYFNLIDILDKNISELSGGQKQILNLASVVAMEPEVIIMDEPSSQLDNISKARLFELIYEINRDFGITIILCEHNLENVLRICNRVVMLDGGKCVVDSSSKEFANAIIDYDSDTNMYHSLPSSFKILNKLGFDVDASISVSYAIRCLEEKYGVKNKKINYCKDVINDIIVECRDIWFRYSKYSNDVIKNLNLEVKKGEIFTILGANGCGKTTLLNVLSNIYKPYRGKVLLDGVEINKKKKKDIFINDIKLLSQDPRDMFVCNKVIDDLMLINKSNRYPDFEEKLEYYSNKFGLEKFYEMNPYDLSGGEQQKLALLKILLTAPKVILLDEPTKGIDNYSKEIFADILLNLKKEGKTIVIVTHDSEFAAKISDRVSMYFNGALIGSECVNKFFSTNKYYTTQASVISRSIIDNAVTDDEVIDILLEDKNEV